jgi:hypothetical protein
MSEPLSTYLQDHLAGAAHAIDLVEFMRDQHPTDELGQFAAGLLVEINADRDKLRQLADRVGAGSSSIKEITARISEKFARLKLRHDAEGGLGIFEALEFLAIGIHGKLELWRALEAIAAVDPRLKDMDFAHLADRAENQHAEVEKHRLRVAYRVFGGSVTAESARTAPHFAPRGQKAAGKTRAGEALLAVAIVAVISLAPDIVRYLKIRAM